MSFIVQRRFKEGWTAAASYTWSDTSGNCFNINNVICYHGLGRLAALTNPATGEPWTVENRDGDLFNGLDHVFKVRGNYLFRLGHEHSINVGGMIRYQSGRRWNTAEVLTPITGENVVHYTEPMGSRTLEDLYQLDLNASWQFPIVKRIEGSLLIEVANVTDAQHQVNFSDSAMLSGNPEAGLTTAMVQNPRSFRALASLRF